MPSNKERKELDAFFKRVELRHKQAVEAFFIDDLKVMGGTQKAATIKDYLEKIAYFREFSAHSTHFESLLESPSMGNKLGAGALAALIGAGTDALTRFASARLSSWTGLPNPIGLIDDTTERLFKGSIAVSVGKSLYNHWTRDSDQKISYQEFEKKLSEEGFNSDRFNELSKQLMVIFHYRECLLIGLKNNDGEDFRKAFLDKFYFNKKVDDKALTIAIEMYFLGELKRLFSEMFDAIYKANSSAIESHQSLESKPILKWFDTIFSQPNNREKFSQQMEYDFMVNTVGFLQTQITQPSTVAKYPKLTASTVGLVGGTVALGIAWAVIGGPFSLGIAAVGLLGAAIFAAASYFAIKKFDVLKFKRNKNNRKAIQGAVDAISEKSVLVKQLIDKQVDTDQSQIKQFDKYNQRNKASRERFISHYILGINTGDAAAGSENSLMREYVSRHRHNILIESEFKEKDITAILAARKQTARLQKALLNDNTSVLKKFIKDSKSYLSKQSHAQFIEAFELKEKIREQILEIVSVLPEDKPVAKRLTDFYVDFLGGHQQVFALAQEFKPHDRQNIARKLTQLGETIDSARNFQSLNRGYILSGDSLYRKILNMQQTDNDVTDINADNIAAILQASYEFLWSLNHHPSDESTVKGFDDPVSYTPEFMLYRTLMMTQLAKLVDLNNANINTLVRNTIRAFVEDKFDVDPDVIFNDIANQSLLFEYDEENPTNNMTDLCAAVRLDLAYTTTPVSARHLIEKARCADDKLNCESCVFGLDMPRGFLVPQINVLFSQRVENTIINTEELIESILKQAYLDEANEVTPFIFQAILKVENLRFQIAAKLSNVQQAIHTSSIEKDAATALYGALQDKLGEHLVFLKSKQEALKLQINKDEQKHHHNKIQPSLHQHEGDEIRHQRTIFEQMVEEYVLEEEEEETSTFFLNESLSAEEKRHQQLNDKIVKDAKNKHKHHHKPGHSLVAHISRGLHRLFSSPFSHQSKKHHSIDELDMDESIKLQ